MSVLVADCTSRAVGSLEAVYDIAITKIRSAVSGGTRRVQCVSESAVHACVRTEVLNILKEIGTMEHVLGEAMVEMRSGNIASAFQKQSFVHHIRYPRSVIDAILTAFEKEVAYYMGPTPPPSPSSTSSPNGHHDGAAAGRISKALRGAAAAVRARLLRLERHLTESLNDVVQDVSALCSSVYGTVLDSMRRIISRVKEATDETKLFARKEHAKLSEYRLGRLMDAVRSADAAVSRSLEEAMPSLVYATWEAANEKGPKQLELRDAIIRSRSSLLHVVSRTSTAITASLQQVDFSATSGIVPVLIEGRMAVSKWERIAFGISIELAIASDGFMPGVITAAAEGRCALEAELKACANMTCSLLRSINMDDAAWLSSSTSTLDSIALELASLQRALSFCEQSGQKTMATIAETFQRGILHPKVRVTGTQEAREMPGVSLETQPSPRSTKSSTRGDIDGQDAGPIVDELVREAVIRSFDELSRSVAEAGCAFLGDIEAECAAVLDSKASSYQTLEHGLKIFMRSVKVVRRKYVDGAAALAAGVAEVLRVTAQGEGVVLRRRVPPLPAHMVVKEMRRPDDDNDLKEVPSVAVASTTVHNIDNFVGRSVTTEKTAQREHAQRSRVAHGPTTNLFDDD